MSRSFFVRNTILGLPSRSCLRLRAIPKPSMPAVRYFHPWRPLTRLPRERPTVKRNSSALPPCPPYPYGPRYAFPEADGGLYGGAAPQSGNKISQGRNKGKTRRRWYLNVRVEDLRSEALDMTLSIKVTAACMRTIRKCGGLDPYLLGYKPARIKELGLFGWKLRWWVLNSPKMREKLQEERNSSALPGTSTESKRDMRQQINLREEIVKEQERQWEAMREKDKRFQRVVKSRWGGEYDVKDVVPDFDAELFESSLTRRRKNL